MFCNHVGPNTTGNIIVLYILTFKFLERSRKIEYKNRINIRILSKVIIEIGLEINSVPFLLSAITYAFQIMKFSGGTSWKFVDLGY